MDQVVKIGLLGFGTVGSSLAQLLQERQASLREITGLDIQLSRVAVRNKERYDFSSLSSDVAVTDDAMTLVNDPEVDVVVELIGGISPAKELVRAALELGKPVVTGNKALIASHGPELFMLAKNNKVDLLFEASTAGAIPILRPLRESLLGEDVRNILGIVNGTCNYILTEMAGSGISYEMALKQAQELGYAEADPTADVDGHDSAAKAAIMASLAFGSEVSADDVVTEGISRITDFDITQADRLGFTIKLLAQAQKIETKGGEKVSVRVFPTLVPKRHPLSAVHGSYNAVFVEGAASSELMFYGKGAGGRPTASAVLGDLVDACRNLRSSTHRLVPSGAKSELFDPLEHDSSYYVTLNTVEGVGVLAGIAETFARFNISIKTIEQYPIQDEAGASVRMVFITDDGLESNYQNLFDELRQAETVTAVTSTIRVI